MSVEKYVGKSSGGFSKCQDARDEQIPMAEAKQIVRLRREDENKRNRTEIKRTRGKTVYRRE